MSDHQTYRYLYEDPLYPFGYGLSYSRFSYDKLTVRPTSLKAGENVSVTVEVTNLGPYDAKEVGIRLKFLIFILNIFVIYIFAIYLMCSIFCVSIFFVCVCVFRVCSLSE